MKGRARILLGHFGSLGGEFPHDSDHGSELSAVHFVDVPTHDWLDGFLFIYLLFTNRGSFSCSTNCPPIAICPCFAC